MQSTISESPGSDSMRSHCHAHRAMLRATNFSLREKNQLSPANIGEYMEHITTLGDVDAISYSACRRWRLDHAKRLVDWAVLSKRSSNLAVAATHSPSPVAEGGSAMRD